jgi:hypothetical protein
MAATDVAYGLRHGSPVAELLRCVFGNPFRPVTPGPWVTPAAVTVARDCYDRRDVSALPVLADLLEEAGCPEQSVLDHCRGPSEHARGCWAVDLVLGKGQMQTQGPAPVRASGTPDSPAPFGAE